MATTLSTTADVSPSICESDCRQSSVPEHDYLCSDAYLQTALRLQRWRDLAAHLTAYLVMNVVFVIAWAVTGGGSFWPAWPILGWGLGLSFQHFHVVIRGFITDANVRRAMQWTKAGGM